jgi:hypothetical protein
MTQKWSNAGPNPSRDRQGAVAAAAHRVTGCQPLPENEQKKTNGRR